MYKLLRTSALICFAAVSIPIAGATVLFSDMSGSPAGMESIQADGPLAASFSTGPTQFSLTQVSVLLSGMTTSGSLSIDLLSDNNTSPGTIVANIGTLSNLLLTPFETRFDFTLNTPFALNSNTRYWIQLTTSTSTDFWYYTLDTTGPGVSGVFLKYYRCCPEHFRSVHDGSHR